MGWEHFWDVFIMVSCAAGIISRATDHKDNSFSSAFSMVLYIAVLTLTLTPYILK